MSARTAILLAALLVAGCGDDSPSKSDFAKRADAICRDGNRAIAPLNRQIAAAQRSSDENKVFTTMARVTTRSVAVSTTYVDRLDALAAPSDDRDKIKSWIADLRRQLALIGKLGGAFTSRDQATIVRLSEQIDALNTRNNRFASQYGMAECAKRA
jgi:hypothetical protein